MIVWGYFAFRISSFEFIALTIMVAAGVAGLALRRLAFDGAPFLLALVLGPNMERSLRQALLISRGSFVIFFTRPIAAVLMILAVAFLLTSLIPALMSKRAKLAAEVGQDE